MSDPRYDVVVIGAGPGGYPCAIRLAQMKKKVLIIEKKEIGGVCLNWGCIPTKALSFAAELKDTLDKAAVIGYKLENRGLDIHVMRAWKENVVKKLRNGVDFLLKNNCVDKRSGIARIKDAQTIEIERNGATEIVKADNIVIATGTEIISLPGLEFDGKFILNTNDALELKEIPDRLLVVGAGASGLEMGTIYSRLGSRVMVVEILDQILPGMEDELCVMLHKILTKKGIEVALSSQVKKYDITEDHLDVAIEHGGKEEVRQFDRILVTVGRRPTDHVFKDVGLKTDGRGYLQVNDRLQTNVGNIYAVGDIVGPPLLAHKATKQGIGCAEIIGGERARYEAHKVPSCVFTIPPFSSVGVTEREAKDQGVKFKSGKFPYRASGKALTMGEIEGLVKIIGDENDRLIGLHILGAESPSLIGSGLFEVEKGVPIADLCDIIYPHPTLTEIIGEAAENYFKKATHVVNQ